MDKVHKPNDLFWIISRRSKQRQVFAVFGWDFDVNNMNVPLGRNVTKIVGLKLKLALDRVILIPQQLL
jgi:hypothetical protein